MTPSTELRLTTMMRAVTEVLMPALNPQDSLAQEQAGLLLGHLNALLQQAGREPEVASDEQQAQQALAKLLLPMAEGGEQTAAARERLQQALAADDAVAMSLALERLIAAADATAEFKAALRQPVLDYATAAAERGRQWFAPMGF